MIGWVDNGDPGLRPDTHNLGLIINDEYRGQGLISGLLETFLNEVTPNGSCFTVVILKENIPSLKLAQKCGFVIYGEDDTKIYLKK